MDELIRNLRDAYENTELDCEIHEFRPHIKAAADALESQQKQIEGLEAKQRWIPVSERLPRPGERVIASNGAISAEAFISTSRTWHRIYGVLWEDCFAYPVTHWMPLPEPPEGV